MRIVVVIFAAATLFGSAGACADVRDDCKSLLNSVGASMCDKVPGCDKTCKKGKCAQTRAPSAAPTGVPTAKPTGAPTGKPTAGPTRTATAKPTVEPTNRTSTALAEAVRAIGARARRAARLVVVHRVFCTESFRRIL